MVCWRAVAALSRGRCERISVQPTTPGAVTDQNLILSISSRVILSPVRSYSLVVCEDS